MMIDNNYLDYTFNLPFENEGKAGYVSVHPEMTIAVQGLTPTGRYFVYCLHPQGGSCSFYIELDESRNWISECLPPFINNDFIFLITDKIPK
ncbi:MAG: hypothetical protein WKF89_02950 [Chitinophagaceae bacterium]